MDITEPFYNIIKRLLEGWEPRHQNGKLIPWWYHPTKPFNYEEHMPPIQFEILKVVDEEMQNEGWIPRDG